MCIPAKIIKLQLYMLRWFKTIQLITYYSRDGINL